MHASAPLIETPRLRLRAHRPEDLDAAAAMWGDPAVTRFIGGTVSTRPQSWARILGYAGHWTLLGFGYWAVEERATGRFAGDVGFADFQRALDPALAGIPEAGWALAPAFHGRGYATEAVRAAVAWADADLGAPRTVCIIRPENVASLRIAAGCGYREWRRVVYGGHATTVFVRRLFADAEAREERVEHRLGRGAAGDLAERSVGGEQVADE